jgi:hypothetical protein
MREVDRVLQMSAFSARVGAMLIAASVTMSGLW